MSASFPNFAAGPAVIHDPELSAHLIENFLNDVAGAATLADETSQATFTAALWAAIAPGIASDAAPVPDWEPHLSPTADGDSQIAAESGPIPNETPPLSFSIIVPNIIFHVGSRDLDEEEFRRYILTIPAGQARVELHKLYVRAKKHMCYEVKADLDLRRSLGSYDDAMAENNRLMEKADSNLMKWGRCEDIIKGEPRAKTLDKIARIWGAFPCDYFRSSNEPEHILRAIASAARSVPDYTTARRLVNENILVRLENRTSSIYRRQRHATRTDWYGIRGMAPIHEPIDSIRLFAIQMHLGELDVLEEGIV